MKILILNQHYWPEIAATAQILADLAESLAKAGHEVHVLCGQPSYRQMEGAPARLASDEVHRQVHIHRVPSYAPRDRTVVKRLAHYGVFFSGALTSSLARAPDVVVVMSTPPLLLGIVGWLMRTFRGAAFVYWVHDLYPDIALDLGVLRPGVLTDSIRTVSSAIYKSADGIVTLSTAMAQKLEARGVARDQLRVIYNWADTDSLTPRSRDNAFAKAHGLTGKFVVQYSGNVGLSQGLEHLPTAAKLVRDLPVLFNIVGDGNARARLEHGFVAAGLTNVKFLPPQPRETLPDLLASSDVGLVTMRRGVEASLVPSKLYGIMAASRPVLAAVEQDSEVANVVRRLACGIVVPPEDPGTLAAEIRKLLVDQGALLQMGRSGRSGAEAEFSRRVSTARFEETLREILTTRKPLM